MTASGVNGACWDRPRAGPRRRVEVFQMGGVRTSIFGRPRPLHRDRRADQSYTLNCEGPSKE